MTVGMVHLRTAHGCRFLSKCGEGENNTIVAPLERREKCCHSAAKEKGEVAALDLVHPRHPFPARPAGRRLPRPSALSWPPQLTALREPHPMLVLCRKDLPRGFSLNRSSPVPDAPHTPPICQGLVSVSLQPRRCLLRRNSMSVGSVGSHHGSGSGSSRESDEPCLRRERSGRG